MGEQKARLAVWNEEFGLFNSVPQVPSIVAGTWQELTEGREKSLLRTESAVVFNKVAAYADKKLEELIAFG